MLQRRRRRHHLTRTRTETIDTGWWTGWKHDRRHRVVWYVLRWVRVRDGRGRKGDTGGMDTRIMVRCCHLFLRWLVLSILVLLSFLIDLFVAMIVLLIVCSRWCRM